MNIPVEANSTNLYTTYSLKEKKKAAMQQCLINAYHGRIILELQEIKKVAKAK